MPTALLVIAQDTFRDEEYARPKEVLERRGAHVVTASIKAGAAIGRFGLAATADVSLADVDPAEYDTAVFVGGGGAEAFFDDPAAHDLAREINRAGKPLAAICIAPSILARAGLLAGVRATAFESREADLREHGAIWTGAPVEIDGLIITAYGPQAAYEFGEAVADALHLPQ